MPDPTCGCVWGWSRRGTTSRPTHCEKGDSLSAAFHSCPSPQTMCGLASCRFRGGKVKRLPLSKRSFSTNGTGITGSCLPTPSSDPSDTARLGPSPRFRALSGAPSDSVSSLLLRGQPAAVNTAPPSVPPGRIGEVLSPSLIHTLLLSTHPQASSSMGGHHVDSLACNLHSAVCVDAGTPHISEFPWGGDPMDSDFDDHGCNNRPHILLRLPSSTGSLLMGDRWAWRTSRQRHMVPVAAVEPALARQTWCLSSQRRMYVHSFTEGNC